MYNVNKNFSISETVNKNIEQHQFPSFRNHKSLIGKLKKKKQNKNNLKNK